MFHLLFALWMLSPTLKGGNGNHFGWRNQQPRTVPGVQVVTPPPTGGGGGLPGNSGPVGDPKGLPRAYGD